MSLLNPLTLLMVLNAVLCATVYSSVVQIPSAITVASPGPALESSLSKATVSAIGLVPSMPAFVTTVIIPGKPWPTDGVTKQTSLRANYTVFVPNLSAKTTLGLGNHTTAWSTVPLRSSSTESASSSQLVITSIFTSTAQISRTGSASAMPTASPNPVNAAANSCSVSVMGILLVCLLVFGFLGA